MQRLANSRDEYASKEEIQDGTLVMRCVMNRKSKIDAP